jgi:formylglycine-generating enzyme required for sulfatase activity
MRFLALTTAAVLLSACSDAVSPSTPPVTTSSARATTAAASREILTDLRRWDTATSASRRAAAEDVARRLPDFALSRMETFSCGGQTHEVAIYSHAKSGLEFVLVPVGTFQMGSPETEFHRGEREVRHVVTLTHPFLVSRTETTQTVWTRVTGTDPAEHRNTNCPVENVSWRDVQAFCDDCRVRLPTEAEWEYACRAGSTTAFAYGDERLGECGWYEINSGNSTHPVGEKRSNAFGLFDMHGNVFEWCADWYGPISAAAATDPAGPADTGVRVFRGGAFSRPARDARSAFRFGFEGAGHRFPQVGFRPVKTVPTE